MADEAKKSSSGGTSLIVGLVVVTLVAAGGGVGLSMMSPGSEQNTHASDKSSDKAEKIKAAGDHEDEAEKGTILVPMKPIITNIGKEAETLIRIESMLVMKAEHSDKFDYIIEKITEDILVYLKSISLSDIQGAFGLVNLMEDLNVRAALRSEGHVTEVLIQSLVVE